MAGIRTIKGRIKSANNIAQITKAMQMVAASKMKKAQARAIAGKPYAEKIYEAMMMFATQVQKEDHPLFTTYSTDQTLSVLISTNKGLVGGLNTTLFRNVLNWQKGEQTKYVTLGKKGRNFARRTKGEIIADFSEEKFIETVSPIIKLVIDEYNTGKYKEVNVIYNKFVSALHFEPTHMPLLPMTLDTTNEDMEIPSHFIIEPSQKELLNALLPHYLETQVRRAILEAEASEYSAQMMAMKNATDNAKALKADLTLEYNKLRQQQITFEIADMITARMTVK